MWSTVLTQHTFLNSIKFKITSEYTRKKSQNVIGYLRGSEYPDEYVLIG
jgi:hypothetical protein